MIAEKIEAFQLSREQPSWTMGLFAFLLVGIHILLPIGNALPTVHLGSVPVHLHMLIYPFFFYKALRSCINNARYRRGLAILFFLIFTQALSLLFSPDLMLSGYSVFYNIWGLIGTYLLACFIISATNPRTFRNALLIAFTLAAVIGIFERVNKIPMWPYQLWYQEFVSKIGYNPNSENLLDVFRIWGTGGNPIIYAVIMMLGIAWAFEETNKYLRWTLICLFFIAAINTLSRTIILFSIPYLIFFLIQLISRKKFWHLLLIGIPLLCLSPLLIPFIDRIKELWDSRIVLESLNSNSGISVRQTIISNVWTELANERSLPFWVIGHGQGAGAIIASNVMSTLDTLDNEYLALLYENGILGLGSFLLFWSLPLAEGLKRFKTNIHLWAILGYLLSGLSFEVIKYPTINFLVFCSLAWILHNTSSHKSTEFMV